MNHFAIRLAVALSCSPLAQASAAPTVHGELKQWHKVTIDFTGPETSESATPNPFTDYRLDVTFTNDGEKFVVPGYYAADGEAGDSGADSGAIWRVHFAPNKTGTWNYSAQFTTGKNVHAGNEGKSAGYFDGATGKFDIAATDKTGRDFRAKGRLSYVGKHHLQFEGTGEFFLKAGVDAPENLLAYADFDGPFKKDGVKDNLIKTWEPHVRDWKEGDPTWRDGKGKGLIGAINYLHSQGLNVFSFLTLNIEGDDRNVFPYTSYKERYRLDCSRLDQWEVVMEHGTRLGMYLHFKTQEAENVNLLDNGNLGPQRKLYYRELIARFGHHLALNWNLGEEVGLGHKITTEKKVAWSKFFADNDPYHHHQVIHNGNNHYDMLGDKSHLTGFSLQTNREDFANVHGATLRYLKKSVEAGKPWVVACDEPGDASHSLIPDQEDPTRNNARRNALWGNLMAGGAGVEWYFGYKHAHSDLTCQDFRVREKMWQQSAIALRFFADHKIPFWNMSNANKQLSGADGYCLREPGGIHLAFLKQAEAAAVDLSDAKGIYTVHWFNPRGGGDLQTGSIKAVHSGGHAPLGNPPVDPGTDWLVFLQPAKGDHPNAAKNVKPLASKINKSPKGNGKSTPPTAEELAPPVPAFKYTYDQSKAKVVHKQTNGIVVVEAEDFDHVDRQFHRKWLLTTKDHTPELKPDPDPSHIEGALGRGYLELLPDTRRTHGDPLIQDVSFTNKPGRCSVLYYPIEFTEAGRYYVWVRINCTGSEDNGIHVGLDGQWPESGARMQWTGHHGKWQWDSRQRTAKVHTGVLGQIWLDIDKPGRHTVMFSMREDGFEFDRFLLTKEKKAMKSKNLDAGPPASPRL